VLRQEAQKVAIRDAGECSLDTKFHAAVDAIKSGDVFGLQELVRKDPSLATGRSTTSHPTLLQCVVLDAKDAPRSLEMAAVLVEAGAEVNEPLGACASIDNVDAAALLLDRGAAVNGTGGWSPLEEALYWNSRRVNALLLQRGASIHNLRIAAGLGRTDLIEAFFYQDGRLMPGAGRIDWPWGGLEQIRQSNHNRNGKEQLLSKVRSWANDDQDVINNAFVYACMHGQVDAAELLLHKGAQVNAIPGGFDFSGTGLHYAALNGHQTMAEFLVEHGADTRIKDTKIGGTPAGWAEHGGHLAIKAYLAGIHF
jgi:ankyrin repeat protein